MIIDTQGLICPQPLIKTKEMLRQAETGEQVTIITDNNTACSNLETYLKELKIDFQTEQQENHISCLTFQIEGKLQDIPAEAFCSVPSEKYLVVFKSTLMGEGDPALGTLLLRGYINALSESIHLPSAIILYNNGAKLAVQGEDSARALALLEEKGVPVYICGTCADFYGIKDQISVGIITHMFKIAQLLSSAGHIVYP